MCLFVVWLSPSIVIHIGTPIASHGMYTFIYRISIFIAPMPSNWLLLLSVYHHRADAHLYCSDHKLIKSLGIVKEKSEHLN